jgi:hypothetical protein
MSRVYLYLLGAALLVSSAAVRAESPARLPGEAGAATLTLTGAKRIVQKSLEESGERKFRTGHAEFDSRGNVLVEIVSLEGLPYRHVLVDGSTGRLVAAKGRGAVNPG